TAAPASKRPRRTATAKKTHLPGEEESDEEEAPGTPASGSVAAPLVTAQSVAAAAAAAGDEERAVGEEGGRGAAGGGPAAAAPTGLSTLPLLPPLGGFPGDPNSFMAMAMMPPILPQNLLPPTGGITPAWLEAMGVYFNQQNQAAAAAAAAQAAA